MKYYVYQHIADLSKLVPISVSTLARLSQGIKVSNKTNNQYEFKKLINEQNTI